MVGGVSDRLALPPDRPRESSVVRSPAGWSGRRCWWWSAPSSLRSDQAASFATARRRPVMIAAAVLGFASLVIALYVGLAIRDSVAEEETETVTASTGDAAFDAELGEFNASLRRLSGQRRASASMPLPSAACWCWPVACCPPGAVRGHGTTHGGGPSASFCGPRLA